ncbi:MAG TPA: VCBS repeat-containing protein [Candidatus Dormibacteraeota bacterium]|nr:VCBS repeat-containing protein [Candidatus Dormibacteraeota bacterium]
MDITPETARRTDAPVCLLAAELLREASREMRCLRLVRGASRRTARRAARATAVLIAAAVMLAAAPTTASAQGADPHFVNPLPFGLTDVGRLAKPAFADIDGDGDLDAFIGAGDPSDANILFFRNTGSAEVPRFAAPLSNFFGFPETADVSSPAFADIDGDGDLDAFMTFRGRTVFLRNTGSATSPAFAAPIVNPFGLPDVSDVISIAFADIDADGDLDEVLGATDGRTVFFANTGTARAAAFGPPVGLVDVGAASAPTFADIDGDGDLDGFIGELNGGLLFFRNTGTARVPAFADPDTNPFGLVDVGSFSSPAFVDIDGDGDLDAFVGLLDGKTLFFRNNGSATEPAFVPPLGLAFKEANGRAAFVDIDGDGDLDAFAGDADGNTLLFGNVGSAHAPDFTEAITNPFGLANVGGDSSPAFADIDGDGDFDAFVQVLVPGRTVFFQNTGTASAPAFAPPIDGPFGLSNVDYSRTCAFADIDGDGDLDAFIGAGDGNTVFFRNTGSALAPAFEPPLTSPFGLADVGTLASTALADVERDGDLDAFVGESGGDTFFFRNTGTAQSPSFAAPVINPFGLANVGTLSGLAFADIDADGDLDALLTGDGRSLYFQNRAPCPGDCNDSGMVAIDELIRGVNIALGDLELTACAAMDVGADGAVSIAELIAAVNAALSGCPP